VKSGLFVVVVVRDWIVGRSAKFRAPHRQANVRSTSKRMGGPDRGIDPDLHPSRSTSTRGVNTEQ